MISTYVKNLNIYSTSDCHNIVFFFASCLHAQVNKSSMNEVKLSVSEKVMSKYFKSNFQLFEGLVWYLNRKVSFTFYQPALNLCKIIQTDRYYNDNVLMGGLTMQHAAYD